MQTKVLKQIDDFWYIRNLDQPDELLRLMSLVDFKDVIYSHTESITGDRTEEDILQRLGTVGFLISECSKLMAYCELPERDIQRFDRDLVGCLNAMLKQQGVNDIALLC